MKTKKLMTLGLAAVMSLSLSTPAFAAASPSPSIAPNTTVFNSTYSEPEIQVTAPQIVEVKLNPLGLDVDLSGEEDNAQTIKGQQIVSTPAAVVNNSSMNLNVSVAITSAIAGNLKFAETQEEIIGNAAANVEADTDSNLVFAFFQMLPTKLTDSEDQEAINKAAVKWAYDYTETATGTGKSRTVAPDEGFAVLAKGDSSNAYNDDENSFKLATLTAARDGDPAAGSIALVRIAGKMVVAPSKGWAATDTFTATVTYTFMPVT